MNDPYREPAVQPPRRPLERTWGLRLRELQRERRRDWVYGFASTVATFTVALVLLVLLARLARVGL